MEDVEAGLMPMVNFNGSGEEESTCHSQPYVVSSAIHFCLEFLFQAVLGAEPLVPMRGKRRIELR